MTDFRTTDQVQTDFRHIGEAAHEPFSQVTNFATLAGLLTDDRLGEAAVYASGSGPAIFDLGILNTATNPEWEGVNRFLNSRLVSVSGRREIQQVQSDLQAADTNHDGVLNNQELVAYAQAHTDRWANVAQFRNAAEILLNRLPGYLAQTNLTHEQVGHFWGVMNHMAGEFDRLGAASGNRGTVYGLSLQGFPSTDQSNPPNLVRRLLNGTATPQELAAVHQVLQTQMVNGQYQFQGSAPLSPMDIGMLGQILDRAAASGHTLYGMTIVNGTQETQLFADRNAASQSCLDGITTALRGSDGNALQTAFGGCATEMGRLEGQNSDRIGARALLLRAYSGDLSPAETALLRRWMQTEASTLGLTCDGTLDCMAQGALQLVRTIARDPWHFIARNGAFIGGAYLYRRLLLRNAFENRLNQACGGTGVANPRDAYRNYERYLNDQMKNSPMWRRFLNQMVRNPRRDGILGKAFINFPVTFLHLAAFNAVAARKDTGNTAVDILTDMPLIALFEGLDTYDALNRSSIANFAAANPSVCRPQPQTAAQPAEAPAPEQETNPASEFSITPAQIRAMTQEQFEEILNSGAPALTPDGIRGLPQPLQGLFTADVHQLGITGGPENEAHLSSLMPWTGDNLPIADALVSRYASNNPTMAETIRQDMSQIAAAYRQLGSISAPSVNSLRWTLRQYIQNLESGGILRAPAYIPMIRAGGVVNTYFGIRESQQVEIGVGNSNTTFAEGARSYWELRNRLEDYQAHPEHRPQPTYASEAELYDPLGGRFYRPWGPMVGPAFTPFGGMPSFSISPSPAGAPLFPEFVFAW